MVWVKLNTAVIPNLSVLALKEQTVSSFSQATSFTAREELIFIPATMLVSAQTILFMLLLTAPLNLKEWAKTAKRFLFIPLSSN